LANSPQAIKRARQQIKRHKRNIDQKTASRTTVKKVLSAVKAEGKEAALAAFKAAVRSLDRLAGKNLIHRNKAARLKSRLNKKIRTLQGASA